MSIMTLAALTCLCAAVAAVPLPQQPSWSAEPVAGVANTVVVVAYARGFDHDPSAGRGLARVVVEARLAAANAAVAARHTGAQVYGDLAIAFGEVAPKDVAAFAAALLGDASAVPDAVLERMLARAALAADDAAWLYPGQVLETRLRAALLHGPAATAPFGDALALHAATVAAVRAELRTPIAMRGTWFGAEPVPAALPALPELPWPPPVVESPAAVGPLTLPSEAHARLDGPHVGVAFALPAGLDRPTLALAIEVARQRAARRLPLRGSEAAARAPVVGWAWRDGAPLVLFCRRGGRGDAAAAQAELAELLADLRRQPPTAAELAAAAQALAGETAPPSPANAQQAGDLVGRSLAVVLARHRGLAAVEWRDIGAESVAAAFAQVLVDERSAWLHLLPVPRREPSRR
jgi:hypothetical protein